MSSSSQTLDDELKVPLSATLTSERITAVLRSGDSRISISPETLLLHPDARRRSLLVGRQAATSDLRIQHGSISRKHAVMYYDRNDDSLILRDLGGKHGTSVNDSKIAENGMVRLKHGDRILFGNVRESVFQVEISTRKEAMDSETTQQQQPPSKEVPAVDGVSTEGLTGRAKRQAEIAAMVASLDEAPTYQVHAPTPEPLPRSADPQSDKDQAQQKRIIAKYALPVTQTFRIASESDRRNAVTALAVDPSGSRFAVGSTDNHLRFYDFSGMDRGRRDSFRSVTPETGHWPVACAFSNTGDRILVGTASVQPVVMDREGHEVIQFVRGDMYVTDQSKTVGHTAAVSDVDWHPLERDWVLTASLDGSARLWNVQDGRMQFKKLCCDKVYSAKNVKGQRTTVTAVCFHPGGREFALGTSCGSVQIWNKTRTSRPEKAVFGIHAGRSVASLTYTVDGTRLASRSAEDTTVQVWNAQRLSRSSVPLVTCRHAGSLHDHANAAFSPDGKILCVGVSENRMVGDKRQEIGRLSFYDVSGDNGTVDPLLSLDTDTNSSPIVVKWHSRINQIFVGCSDGQILVLYDANLSNKGALIAASKVGRSVDDLSALLNSRAPTGSAGVSGEIVTPFSLPMYREERVNVKKRKREERKDPVKSREPERPATGKHKTGGQTGSLNFAQAVADQTMSKSKAIAGKDPREALFQYNEGASFVDRAYEGNKSQLAEKTAEEEEEEFRRKSKRSSS